MATAVEVQPNAAPATLDGRRARCVCGKLEASSPTLAFFEFRGVGSENAQRTCARCGYRDTAHTTQFAPGATVPSPRYNVVERGRCTGFVARGAAEFDAYYCGCAGWD